METHKKGGLAFKWLLLEPPTLFVGGAPKNNLSLRKAILRGSF